MTSGEWRDQLIWFEAELKRCARFIYRRRLITLAVFGSAGRLTLRHDSDIDILIAADQLPNGRVARNDEFVAVERCLADALEAVRNAGLSWYLSPVIKSREEVTSGSPLFLDMTQDARLLVDEGGFFAGELDRLKRRLNQLGARRVWRGSAWYWDLKPDYVPGETFRLYD